MAVGVFGDGECPLSSTMGSATTAGEDRKASFALAAANASFRPGTRHRTGSPRPRILRWGATTGAKSPPAPRHLRKEAPRSEIATCQARPCQSWNEDSRHVESAMWKFQDNVIFLQFQRLTGWLLEAVSAAATSVTSRVVCHHRERGWTLGRGQAMMGSLAWRK